MSLILGSVAVVGNGECLLDSRHGASIDAHDEVARINGYELAGFEDVAGTRTTIFCTFYGNVLREGSYRHRWVFDMWGGESQAAPEGWTMHPYRLVEDAKRLLNLPGSWMLPSTGFMVVHFLLNHCRCDRISLFGFGGRKVVHYFDTERGYAAGWKYSGVHSYEREREVLDELARSSAVAIHD